MQLTWWRARIFSQALFLSQVYAEGQKVSRLRVVLLGMQVVECEWSRLSLSLSSLEIQLRFHLFDLKFNIIMCVCCYLPALWSLLIFMSSD